MLSTLVIASHNEGKVREIRALLAPYVVKVISAAEAGVDEPEETGQTFVENSELKARHTASKTNLPALADDSGLVIPTLGGAPGIYSARWAGPNKDFSAAFMRIQNELPKREKHPAAYFVCVLSLCMPDGQIRSFEGRVDGHLTFPPRGTKGFGYDPIFIPSGYDMTFAELDPTLKNSMSHRARAFEQLEHFLKSGEKLYA